MANSDKVSELRSEIIELKREVAHQKEALRLHRELIENVKRLLMRLIATRPPRSMGREHDDLLAEAQDWLSRHPPRDKE